MDLERLRASVRKTWNESILERLIAYVRIPNKSPLFDPQWESHGHMEAAVQRFKGEADRRDDAFKRSVEQHKSHADVLNKKFDEMLRLAKENPDEPPPKRDIDFD